MLKGKALVEAGHLWDVQEEHKIDVNYYTISANVSSTSYSTKLIVSKSFKMFNYLIFLKLYNWIKCMLLLFQVNHKEK